MTNITPKKLRFILIAVLLLSAIVFLAITSYGMKSLNVKSQELVDAKLKNRTVEAQLTSLELAKKQVEKYTYFNDVAKTVIPNDKDQAQAVLDIFKLANQSGIPINSITFPASNLGVRAAPASATGAGSTTSAISQAKAVEGIKGLYSLELTIAPQNGPQISTSRAATYAKFLDFLQRLERNRRTAQVAQVSIQPQLSPSGEVRNINFSLSVNIFIRPTK